ncbi:MAG: hypothetical protein FJ295_17325 [Planctomycetes bacterium]|nr:hypothetical protein [Planctomycetota bacterium]
MTHLEQVDRVREWVRTHFASMGAGELEIDETILIRNGHYCGRRFQAGGLRAIWFLEEDQIKFYGRDGRVQSELSPPRPSHRRAA